MLDEMDKLGQGFHGDPSSALLEVLDPEQNNSFRDNYLAVPFDLSQVMFIATANVLDSIPGPLRDRMEVIELPGYTLEDKLQIARRYLIERQLKACGLSAEQVELTDAAIGVLIDGYTREAGCRNLEREIGAVLRHVAVRVAEGQTGVQRIDADDVPAILGARKFDSELAMRTAMPGVATGLAWTPVGGDILFIEASRVPGNGKLILTGQLGDVMKESVQAALSLLKARADTLGLEADSFDKHDTHVHVPAGARLIRGRRPAHRPVRYSRTRPPAPGPRSQALRTPGVRGRWPGCRRSPSCCAPAASPGGCRRGGRRRSFP
jgi:ATP-dependent Lon protease